MADTPDNTEPKWRRRANARPDEVMDAALDLFMENGFAATRVGDIAKRAGLSKGAIYLYFDSKEAILKALIQRSIVPVVESSETLAQNMSGDPQMVIRMIVTLIADRMNDPRIFAIPRLVIAEAGNFPELAQMYRNEVIERGFQALERLLKQGVEQGIFRPMNTRLAIRNIAGPLVVHGLLSSAFKLDSDTKVDPGDFVTSHLDILFNGLLVEPQGV